MSRKVLAVLKKLSLCIISIIILAIYRVSPVSSLSYFTSGITNGQTLSSSGSLLEARAVTLLSKGKRTVLSSNAGSTDTAGRATDGDKSTDGSKQPGCVETKKQDNPWLRIDLGQRASIANVKLYNRSDCCAANLHRYVILYHDDAVAAEQVSPDSTCDGLYEGAAPAGEITIPCYDAVARYVTLYLMDNKSSINVCEVEVYGSYV